MSDKEIVLKQNLKIAQIFFETLTEVPDETYDKKKDASFNNEDKYGNRIRNSYINNIYDDFIYIIKKTSSSR